MITIFDPRGIAPEKYKKTYSELGTIEEFRPLSGKELVFVWYFSNKTSPLIISNIPPVDRVELALKRSWLLDGMQPKTLSLYKELVFPEHLQEAMKRMASFNPDIRDRAKLILVSMFDNLSKIGDLDNFKDKDGSYDMTAYANAAKSVTATMPTLIKQMEDGFGVKDVDEVMAEETGDDLLTRYHEKK